MAELKGPLKEFFRLLRSERSYTDEEKERMCKEARTVFTNVESEINIQWRGKIQELGEVIGNAEEKQFQSALQKIDRAEKAYDYVMKHLQEKNRVDAKQQGQLTGDATKSKDSAIRSDLTSTDVDWTRNDVVDQYKHLFDNEWENAFDELRENRTLNKDEICEDLYRIMREAYGRSKDVVENTIDAMDSACRQIVKDAQVTKEDAIKDNASESLLLLFIRQNFEHVRGRLLKETRENLSKYKTLPKTVKYAEQCASIAWWMRVQDPPMSIAYVGKGEVCRPESYEYYGKPGRQIRYRVMPALLTDSNGEVLVKGKMACEPSKL